MSKRLFGMLFAAVIGSSANAADLPSFPFIHTSGSASLQVLPDIGELDFDVVMVDKDGAAAWQAVEAQTEKIRALVSELGGDKATTDVQGVPRDVDTGHAGSRANGPDADGQRYKVRSSIHITVRDLRIWTRLVNDILSLPGTEGFATAFSRSDRVQIESDLIAQSISDAYRRAEDIARGFGRHVGAVNAISTSPLKNVSNAIGLPTAESYRKLERPPQAEQDSSLIAVIKMVQSVDVIYRIK